MARNRQKIYSALLAAVLLMWAGCKPADTSETLQKAPSAVTNQLADEDEALPFGAEITITGKLINTFCYGFDDPDRRDVSDECAAEGSRKGMPVAVFDNRKRVRESWILLVNPLVFADYMNRTARVRGEVRGKGVLMPIRVELETDKGWMFIM